MLAVFHRAVLRKMEPNTDPEDTGTGAEAYQYNSEQNLGINGGWQSAICSSD